MRNSFSPGMSTILLLNKKYIEIIKYKQSLGLVKMTEEFILLKCTIAVVSDIGFKFCSIGHYSEFVNWDEYELLLNQSI